MSLQQQSRRSILTLFALFTLFTGAGALAAEGPSSSFPAAYDDEALMKRFEYLSRNGNSTCSGAFMDSIGTMPVVARLQGSCCAPMDAHRYVEQVRALRAYAHIAEIPPDPYDVAAGLASALMAQYDAELTPEEQVAYDYAMENSDERGPCCCRCWRWTVYGGLAKQLIREHGFTGEQITEVWDLSSGCGGAEHHHG